MANISYQVSLASISQHCLDICLTIPSPSPDGQQLWLPAWIPGSYMIRDFAKNIMSLQAFDSDQQPLTVTKLDKQSWQLPAIKGPVQVKYQIYAFDFSIRSAYIDHEYAFFNGTSVFLAVEGQTQLPTSVYMHKPISGQCRNWLLATSLPLAAQQPENGFGEYIADDYQSLIDHPVLMGDLDVIDFQVQGCDFSLVLAGQHNADKDRLSKDLAAICRHHIHLFATEVPVKRYLFLTLLTGEGFGGLEHSSSTALVCSRHDLPTKAQKQQVTDGYRTFLSLCSHELFHTWHVKRIRPQALKAADPRQEAYTEQLWIYEGFTSYFDDLSLVRTGLIEPQSYLELLGQSLTRLQRNPGRQVQSVTDSSWYTWTKFYKQDENAANAIVSYYTKGAIIALCLDLLIRQQSAGSKRLEDVMHYLWQHHGQTDIGTPDDIIHQIGRHLGLELDDFLQSALYSTDELPVRELLQNVGIEMKLRAKQGAADKGGTAPGKAHLNEFGANITASENGLKVLNVIHGTPAEKAGVMAGDILVALDNQRLTGNNLQTLLDSYCVGHSLSLHVFRKDLLVELQLQTEAAMADTVYLQITDKPKAEAWLKAQ